MKKMTKSLRWAATASMVAASALSTGLAVAGPYDDYAGTTLVVKGLSMSQLGLLSPTHRCPLPQLPSTQHQPRTELHV